MSLRTTIDRRRIGALLAAPILLGVASVAAGCSSEESAAGSTEATTTPVEAAAERLAGRYAHYDVVAYESSDMKTLIISFGFTDLTEDDGGLVAKESFCHAEHRSDQPIETTMSDAATSAIRPVATPVELTTVDGRARIQRPETPTGIGIHLEDPANDTLPTDPTDPRIADDDNDGNPGVTAHIKVSDELEGDLFIARRERFAYDVTEQPDASLTGTVTDRSEQLIVGATNPIFITDAPWVQYPDLTKSPIILEPVGADWDCARLMAERDSLFPPTPTVDW